MTGQTRPAQTRPSQARPGDARFGDTRFSDTRPGDARFGDTRPRGTRSSDTHLGDGYDAPVPLCPSPPRAPVAALTGLFLLVLLGAWLIAAPFLLGDQARAAAWTTATRVDVATGAVLTLIALTGLLGYLGAAVGWSARYSRS